MSAKQLLVMLALLAIVSLSMIGEAVAAPVLVAANLGPGMGPHDVVAACEKIGLVWWVLANAAVLAVHVWHHRHNRPTPRCALVATVWGGVALCALVTQNNWLLALCVGILIGAHICEATCTVLDHLRDNKPKP